MSLEEKIQNDIKTAMKAKDKATLEAVRAIKGAILLAKTEKGGSDFTENDEIKMLQKLVKQRKDSATIYKEQNRVELAEKEIFEASVIEKYLPEQLSEEDIKNEIQKIVEDLGASSMADMGKVMGIASKKLAGKADGKTMSGIVRELLS